ncbi:hypothetical protein GQ44DRAFT_711140 [Phaeosphaeriaceae sp. PMI808]|nr:hypothetical protein GQ44DRAFT_711140 [Phaeosphaeriaceae sp. PMI808]
MPRFLHRIFPDNPFRKEHSPSDDIQRTRRVLVRSSTSGLEGSSHRISLFERTLHAEESAALRDGASIAGSSTFASDRPILGLSDRGRTVPAPKITRERRRLSKNHRRPA